MDLKTICYEDLPALTEIARESLIYDRITASIIAEKIFEEPHYRPDHSLKALKDGQIVSFMVGHVDDEKTGWIKVFATHPQFRRRGYAKALLKELEERFRSDGAKKIRTMDCVPNYLSAGIDPRYTEAVVMFERSGYTRVDDRVDMLCRLDQDLSTEQEEDRLARMGLAVRRITEADQDSLFEMVAKHWPSWRYECENGIKNDPPSVHIALDEDRVVAFSVYEGNNKGIGWFGPMGTDPEYRGCKIGEILLKRCLADIRSLGHTEAIIPWVGPISFYLNTVNAHVYRVFWVFEKNL
ncbi:MAG TPA: GNAT family N-acetyltransferase [bacterium]|nr:GNAT family N-acetyltransferase [bacterium]HQL64056.1 GNAT family N-acetyltransferase [bacterium]